MMGDNDFDLIIYIYKIMLFYLKYLTLFFKNLIDFDLNYIYILCVSFYIFTFIFLNLLYYFYFIFIKNI